MSALWGLGQMSFVKTIVAVDADVDVQNEAQILKLLLDKVDLARDLFFSEGILDVLNHASDRALYGSKLGIDATCVIDGEPPRTPVPDKMPTPEAGLAEQIKENFPEVRSSRLVHLSARRPILLVALDKQQPGQGKEFIQNFFKDEAFSSVGVLLVLEAHVNLDNTSQVLWKLFNNLDPKRDVQISGQRAGIDVTRKMPEEGYRQNWPEEIVMSDEIKQRVDQKWPNLF